MTEKAEYLYHLFSYFYSTPPHTAAVKVSTFDAYPAGFALCKDPANLLTQGCVTVFTDSTVVHDVRTACELPLFAALRRTSSQKKPLSARTRFALEDLLSWKQTVNAVIMDGEREERASADSAHKANAAVCTSALGGVVRRSGGRICFLGFNNASSDLLPSPLLAAGQSGTGTCPASAVAHTAATATAMLDRCAQPFFTARFSLAGHEDEVMLVNKTGGFSPHVRNVKQEESIDSLEDAAVMTKTIYVADGVLQLPEGSGCVADPKNVFRRSMVADEEAFAVPARYWPFLTADSAKTVYSDTLHLRLEERDVSGLLLSELSSAPHDVYELEAHDAASTTTDANRTTPLHTTLLSLLDDRRCCLVSYGHDAEFVVQRVGYLFKEASQSGVRLVLKVLPASVSLLYGALSGGGGDADVSAVGKWMASVSPIHALAAQQILPGLMARDRVERIAQQSAECKTREDVRVLAAAAARFSISYLNAVFATVQSGGSVGGGGTPLHSRIDTTNVAKALIALEAHSDTDVAERCLDAGDPFLHDVLSGSSLCAAQRQPWYSLFSVQDSLAQKLSLIRGGREGANSGDELAEEISYLVDCARRETTFEDFVKVHRREYGRQAVRDKGGLGGGAALHSAIASALLHVDAGQPAHNVSVSVMQDHANFPPRDQAFLSTLREPLTRKRPACMVHNERAADRSKYRKLRSRAVDAFLPPVQDCLNAMTEGRASSLASTDFSIAEVPLPVDFIDLTTEGL